MYHDNLNSNSGQNTRAGKHSCDIGLMRLLLCAALLTLHLLIFCKAANAVEGRRLLDVIKLPQNGALASDFIPVGWQIESTISGDLNSDGKLDSVLTLIEDLPAKVNDVPNERYRALVILLKTKKEKLQRIAAANRLLRCSTCYGMLAGPNGGEPAIKIVKGILIIEELWGSRETVNVTLRFRYDVPSKRMVLIGEDINRSDRATGANSSESKNFLTGIKITEGTQYDAQQNRLTRLSPQKQRIPKIKRFIEDVDYEDFER